MIVGLLRVRTHTNLSSQSMDHFQCFECGMITSDEILIKNHMNKSHNIKVEVNLMSRKFPCSLCEYTTRNMDELRAHLINQHKKENHNWMVEEIIAVYTCDECQLNFPRMSQLESHINAIQSEGVQPTPMQRQKISK